MSEWSEATLSTLANTPPAFTGAPFAFALAENADGGTTPVVLGTGPATDADGEAVRYGIAGGNDANKFAIDATSGQLTYVGSGEDFERLGDPSNAYRLTVRAIDVDAGGTPVGGQADARVTVSVTDVAEPPAQMAAPTFPDDGVRPTRLTVEWEAPANTGPDIQSYDLRLRAGSNTEWHRGLTGTSHTLEGGLLAPGGTVAVRLTATNAEGTSPDGVEGTVTLPDATVPDAPAKPSARPTRGSRTSLDVTWRAPYDGGSAITDYDVQYKVHGTSSWTSHPHTGTDRTATIGGLTEFTRYEVQVRARNTHGPGAWSASGTGTAGGLRFVGATDFTVKEHHRGLVGEVRAESEHGVLGPLPAGGPVPHHRRRGPQPVRAQLRRRAVLPQLRARPREPARRGARQRLRDHDLRPERVRQ